MLKPRQRAILQALRDLGGDASTREIAAKLGLPVNGVAQSLGSRAMYDKGVRSLGGRAGDARWQIASRHA